MFTPCLIVFLSSSCFLLIIFPLLPTREYMKSHHTSCEENELNSFKIKSLCIYEAWGWKCRVSCHVIHTVEMSFWIDIYVYMKRFWQNDEQNQTFLSYHNNCVNCKKINQKSAKVMVRKRQNKQKWFIEKLCCFHPLTYYCSWTMNTYIYEEMSVTETMNLMKRAFQTIAAFLSTLCFTMYRSTFLIPYLLVFITLLLHITYNEF